MQEPSLPGCLPLCTTAISVAANLIIGDTSPVFRVICVTEYRSLNGFSPWVLEGARRELGIVLSWLWPAYPGCGVPVSCVGFCWFAKDCIDYMPSFGIGRDFCRTIAVQSQSLALFLFPMTNDGNQKFSKLFASCCTLWLTPW